MNFHSLISWSRDLASNVGHHTPLCGVLLAPDTPCGDADLGKFITVMRGWGPALLYCTVPLVNVVGDATLGRSVGQRFQHLTGFLVEQEEGEVAEFFASFFCMSWRECIG
jgi:hypothetical protein